jgi:hypothetical protein
MAKISGCNTVVQIATTVGGTYYDIAETNEVSKANGRWLYARNLAHEYDRKMNVIVNPQITSAWDYGKVMLDGRIACQVPLKYGVEFGGIEIELMKSDFPIVETEK